MSTDAAATAAAAFKSRTTDVLVLSREQAEGVGARVRRSIGRPELRHFSPFLMLDEFKVSPPSGFFAHPHRGQETVTFMLDGTIGHEDFAGHSGVIGPLDLQWMTAGRGIVHCELPSAHLLDAEESDEGMPAARDIEPSRGLQLWVNLKAADKMCKPAYQELRAKDIPTVTKDGVTAMVIAGSALGVESRVRTRTPTHYLYFKMEPGSELHQPIPAGWNAFFYTLKGTGTYCGTQVEAHHTVTLKRDGDGATVRAGRSALEFVLISGEPIDEPVVQHGPFVMNTQEQIMQAFYDYQRGKNGFERAPGFVSRMEEKYKSKFY